MYGQMAGVSTQGSVVDHMWCSFVVGAVIIQVWCVLRWYDWLWFTFGSDMVRLWFSVGSSLMQICVTCHRLDLLWFRGGAASAQVPARFSMVQLWFRLVWCLLVQLRSSCGSDVVQLVVP